jgi:hypothetical protein
MASLFMTIDSDNETISKKQKAKAKVYARDVVKEEDEDI